MNRSESLMKWILAIVIIFGLLTTFFLLNWATVLKVALIIIAIALIGCILLQSGRGGGLAAIGGLSDQSMMGTKTGSFLGNVTYLIGGALFVTVIFLSKASLTTSYQVELPVNEAPVHAPHGTDVSQEQKDSSAAIEEAAVGMTEVDSSVGMKEAEKVDATDVKDVAPDKKAVETDTEPKDQ